MKHLPFLISLKNSPNALEAIKAEFNLRPYQVTKAERLLTQGLPPLVRTDILPYLLGVSKGLIVSMTRFPERHYRTYRAIKASGGYRTIEAPKSYLKMIQRWIYDYTLSKRILPDYVTGFVPSKNIFDNANIHLESKNVMVIDIAGFFNSVNDRTVFDIFYRLGFPVKVSYSLTKLCTLRHRLPQGAPTSPMLANIAFQPVDAKLLELCNDWECQYSRYADDIAFSGNRVFSRRDIAIVAKSG